MRLRLVVISWLTLQVSATAADRFDAARFLRTLLGRNKESRLDLLVRLQTEFNSHPATAGLPIEAAQRLTEQLEKTPKASHRGGVQRSKRAEVLYA